VSLALAHHDPLARPTDVTGLVLQEVDEFVYDDSLVFGPGEINLAG
jgi:hypothetical protein